MTKPTTLPVWDTGLVNITATPVGQQTSGWSVNQIPPSGVMNNWQNLTYQYIAWVDSTFGATSTLSVPISAPPAADGVGPVAHNVATSTRTYTIQGLVVGRKVTAVRVRLTDSPLAAWAGSTSYSLNQRVTNVGNVYQVITPGTSAGAGGPSTTAGSITDGGVTWTFINTVASATNVGSVFMTLFSVSDGAGAATLGTSARSNGGSVGTLQTLTLTLAATIASATTYYLTISDTGVTNTPSSIFSIEVDYVTP